MKKAVKFYDVFKLGIEIEGEFYNNYGCEDCEQLSLFSVVGDDSIENRSDGYTLELVSGIIRSLVEENAIIRELKSLETGGNVRKQFGYSNNSAGTHIHFSFSNTVTKKLKPLANDVHKDFYLHLFDSVDFERYFFKKYFAAFKLEKFLVRLRNNYCRTYIPYRSGKLADESLAQIERTKGGTRDRYFWLNNECLRRGQGMELRIFPHVVTAGGMRDILKFTRNTLLSYWKLKKTQKRLPVIHKFFKIYHEYNINKTELSKYNKVLYEALYCERSTRFVSMDFMEFYVHLFGNNKKAFVKSETLEERMAEELRTAPRFYTGDMLRANN